MDLSNATVLITGGSRGIGRATAELLAEHGAHVAITSRHEEEVKQQAEKINGLGIQADVANPEDVENTYEVFFQHFDRLDVLINNAGTVAHSEIGEMDFEKMQQVYDVNIFGAARMGDKAAKVFKEQKSGNIINIGSTAGLRGMPQGSIYVSSKFALRGLSECWKAELRPYNVRVFQINPSEVKTSFGTPDGKEKEEQSNKLRGNEIAHTISSLLSMDNRGFIPECSVIATNPWD